MSTAYRTTCEECGWTATLATEAEADRAGEQHECPPPLPACGTCERPMRPSGSRVAEYPGTVPTQRAGLCQICHRGHKPREEKRVRGVGGWASHWGETVRLTEAERTAALCAQTDPELFFPSVGDSGTANTAKRVCGACPIRQRCLDVALANREEHGIFGATTAKERAALLRAQNRSAAA